MGEKVFLGVVGDQYHRGKTHFDCIIGIFIIHCINGSDNNIFDLNRRKIEMLENYFQNFTLFNS